MYLKPRWSGSDSGLHHGQVNHQRQSPHQVKPKVCPQTKCGVHHSGQHKFTKQHAQQHNNGGFDGVVCLRRRQGRVQVGQEERNQGTQAHCHHQVYRLKPPREDCSPWVSWVDLREAAG